MKNLIEIVLEEKTKGQPSSILFSQWEFDKRLIPNALQAISALFPHYSLHNESHSETIISNYIKILSENIIRQLSATDLWLLLESAYCHDLGMIITADIANEAINSGKILDHLKLIQSDETHELYFSTKCLSIDKNTIVYTDNDFSLEKTDVVKYLLADYFRKQHGTIASGYILDPFPTLSLKSPRAIIPNRLYEILGKVCEAHTKDFNTVIDLPRFEDGINIDATHPRFIACMLRLGDLLDIDNGRFSETLLRTLGEIPNSTSIHKDKHMSIKHKSISNKEIEIIAECDRKEVAFFTQQWFNLIHEEFTVQTLTWNNIVPPFFDFYLPTVKILNVNLVGYEYIDPKAKPVFTVDTPKALELLKGANFYESPFKAIRELLQNAIDATLIRVWEENKESISCISELLAIINKYRIEITIEDNNDGFTNLVIKDQGTGISRNDLKFLSSTGSSSKNIKRRNKISEMPEWMRPTGVFGIGFQSSFLLTDLVKIQTNSIYTNEAYIVELHSPQSKYKGDIYIKNDVNVNSVYNYGTTLNIAIDKRKVFDKSIIKSNFHMFSDNFSFAYFGVLEELRETSKCSFIPIIINGEPIVREKFDFISSNNIEIKYIEDGNLNRGLSFYYKNIATSGIGISHFPGIINYHNSDSNILELSRKEIKKEYINIIKKDCIKGLEDYFNFLKNSGKIPLQLAYSIYINSVDPAVKTYLQEYMLDNCLLPQTKTDNSLELITVRNLVQKEQITIIKKGLSGFLLKVEANSAIIEMASFHYNFPQFDIFEKELTSYPNIMISDCYIENSSNMRGVTIKLEYSKSDIVNNITIEKIKQVFEFFTPTKYTYYYIPLISKYKNLEIKYNYNEGIRTALNYEILAPISCILFPLVKINNNEWLDERGDKFYNYVFENLVKKVEIEEIDKIYSKLIEDCRAIGFNIIKK